MRLKIKNNIIIEDATYLEKREIATHLSIVNPVYNVMKRQGNIRALYALQQYIKYYKMDGDNMIVGRGVINYLLKNFSVDNIDTNFSTNTVIKPIKKKVVLRQYQEGIIEKILEHQQGIIKLSTGYGKCHGKGTKILMFDGSTKKVEDIIVGDKLMGIDSTPRNVISLARGTDKMYKIIPVKGESFTCNSGHILSLKKTGIRNKFGIVEKGEIVNIELKEYLKTTKTFKHRTKLWRNKIDFPNKEIFIDPYFLGIWLGDGTSRTSEINNPDIEVEKFLRKYCKQLNLYFKKVDDGIKCKKMRLSVRRSKKKIPLVHLLDRYNLRRNKHIPDDFKFNSKDIRLKLLAGLIDSDGHYFGNCFEIITKYKVLNDDILFLCRSLGLAAYSRECIKGIKSLNYYNNYHRITISGNIDIIPTKIKRKQGKKRKQIKDHLVTGFKVKHIGRKKYYGFNLDGDRLYMLSDFTVNHNSFISMKMIEDTQLKTLIVVPRLNLLKQYQSDIKGLYGEQCGIINGQKFDVKDITVATIQTLKLRSLKEIQSEFGMIIWDEMHLFLSDKGIKVVQSFNPLRMYGMSATPDRSDGQGEALKFYFGDIIVEDSLPQAKPVVNIHKYQGTYFADTYSGIIDLQSQDENRNKLIADIINKEIYEGRKIIVLTKRVDHYQQLAKLITSSKTFSIRATLPTKEANEQQRLLERLREGSGDFDAILGTFSLLSTGINIPALDTIVFAGDIKSTVLTTQSIGRILRLFEGKKTPKIIDIDDCRSGILANQARLRRKFYKENEWEIINN